MKVLRRYVAREVLVGTLLVLAALTILFAFYDLIHELRDLGHGNYRLPVVLTFVLLSVPGHFYELFPIAALIGTLYALTQFAKSSELTVMRTSGMSLAALGGALMRVGLLFAVVQFAIGEWVVPFAERIAQQRQLEAMDAVVATQFRSGLWVKDEQSFVNVQEMLPDTTLLNLKIYQFDESHRLRSISFAKRGEYRRDRERTWRIRDVERTLFDAGGRVRVTREAEIQWQSVLTPEILGVLLIVPEEMSLSSLVTYIGHLRENHQKTARYVIAACSKVIYPLAILVMMLLALPFSLRLQRSAGVGGRVFLGIMLGLGFHLLSRTFASLGVIHDWNPLLSAISPTAIFLTLAIGGIWFTERR